MAIKSIDDAIEAHQCKLTVEGAPWLFEESDLSALRDAAKKAFGKARKYVNSNFEQPGIRSLLDDAGRQYLAQFWLLLGSCGAERRVNGQELQDLLIKQPYCLGCAENMRRCVRRWFNRLPPEL